MVVGSSSNNHSGVQKSVELVCEWHDEDGLQLFPNTTVKYRLRVSVNREAIAQAAAPTATATHQHDNSDNRSNQDDSDSDDETERAEGVSQYTVLFHDTASVSDVIDTFMLCYDITGNNNNNSKYSGGHHRCDRWCFELHLCSQDVSLIVPQHNNDNNNSNSPSNSNNHNDGRKQARRKRKPRQQASVAMDPDRLLVSYKLKNNVRMPWVQHQQTLHLHPHCDTIRTTGAALILIVNFFFT